MTKDEKIEYLSRLFMYVVKIGYQSDIDQVEYFTRGIADQMGIEHAAHRTEDLLNPATLEMDGTDEEVMNRIKARLMEQNP